MQLTKSQTREIKQIMSQMECPKDFICHRSGFENLCKVKDVGLEFLMCLGTPTDRICKHTVAFECDFLCTCPLRIYIARNLEIPHTVIPSAAEESAEKPSRVK